LYMANCEQWNVSILYIKNICLTAINKRFFVCYLLVIKRSCVLYFDIFFA